MEFNAKPDTNGVILEASDTDSFFERRIDPDDATDLGVALIRAAVASEGMSKPTE